MSFLRIVLAYAFVCMICLSAKAFAADFTVNLTTDPDVTPVVDGVCDIDSQSPGEQCTLREAVAEAGALSSNDRVLFNLPAGSAIVLKNGMRLNDIFFRGALEIVGTGANNLTIDGGPGTNLIFFITNAKVTISGVTLTGGNGTDPNSSGFGGAIRVEGGELKLDSVHVTGNSATADGGGVYFGSGTHLVVNSTFSGNTSGQICGGLSGNNVTIINSTISDNTAGASGGGLCIRGNSTLRNVTVTNNTAGDNIGGLRHDSGTLDLGNTIVAGNAAPRFPEISSTAADTFTSTGGNLIGDSPGDSANTERPITYHPIDILDTNPILGILRDNGGPTPTHALLLGSPAIDAGLNSNAVDPSTGVPLTTDQRGPNFPRLLDGNSDGTTVVDIGAYETVSSPPAAVKVLGLVATSSGMSIPRAYVTITNSRGQVWTSLTNGFGYYLFEGLLTGETYTFTVTAKGLKFSPRQIVLNDELTDLDFVPDMQPVKPVLQLNLNRLPSRDRARF